MKLRYFIPSIIAVVAAVFTGCSDNQDPTYLDGIRVSQSYVSIPGDGGSSAINVTTAESWSVSGAPDWLTVSPASGTGSGSIVFSAEGATASRSCELLLNSGNETQRINVLQYAEETEPEILTVAEAVAMINAGTQPEAAVYVRGIVCRIQEISVQYGNATYFISDDGSYQDGKWLEIYRGYWFNGNKFTKGDEFGVGDELVIKGVLMSYNGTPETSQGTCEVISQKKSLIGIESVEMLGIEEGLGITEFPLEGGQAKITVNSKGNGFHIAIPETAKSWLHIADFGADYVALEADANVGGDRNVTVTLSTTADGTTYTCEQSFTQKGAIIEGPISDFLAAEVGDTQFRLTGVITELYASDKQGKSFYIADYSGKTLIYRVEGFIEAGAKVGDVVTIVGKRGAYKDSPQMVSGTFEKLQYAVTEVTIADFLTKADAKDVYYMVSGTVAEIANDTYGNLYISDGTNKLYVYGCYPGWGATGDARKGAVAANNIAVGDKLTVIGPKSTYKDTPQVNGGIFFSVEKAN